MTFQVDTGALLDRARKYERQGRAEEAAAAFAEAAGALEARADWPSAVAARARHARALASAGRADEALRALDAAERAASGLPEPSAGPRAVLDGQAAHVLAAAGRTGDAARRAWASMAGFRAAGDHKRADVAAVHAAKLIVRDAGGRGAVAPLRDLLARIPPGGDGHRQVAALLDEAERRPDRDHDVIVTDPDRPVWGRLAAALAVGAHLAVGNGVAWNHPGAADERPERDRELLERDWGVTDPGAGARRPTRCSPPRTATPRSRSSWTGGAAAPARTPGGTASPRGAASATPPTGRPARYSTCRRRSCATRRGSAPTGCSPRTAASTASSATTSAAPSTWPGGA
ncbi:hypothetical protein ACFQHO_44290 [Actinomadura yumaensis]|uniref:hypothetical protein n=1 Tax=Actinomadura yumaensis TaxID=111807 RepID=UPI0036232422